MKNLVKGKAIQLFKAGEFWVNGLDGKRLDLNHNGVFFKALRDNFKAHEVNINYAHNESGPSAGKIAEIFEQDGTIWGYPMWTQSALKGIEAGEWRHVSPEYAIKFQDQDTNKDIGPTLTGLGLTNQPAQYGMEPIKASEGRHVYLSETMPLTMKEGTMDKLLKMLREHFELSETSTEDDISLKLGELFTSLKAKVNTPEPKADKKEDTTPEPQKLSDGKFVVDPKEWADYQVRIGELTHQATIARIDSAYMKLSEAGRIGDAERETFKRACLADFDRTVKTYEARPAYLKLSEIIGHGKDTDDGLTSDERQMCAAQEAVQKGFTELYKQNKLV